MAKKPTAPEPEAAPMLSLIETPNVPVPTAMDQARIVLLDAREFDQFYDKVKGETDAHTPDVSTRAGRDAIKSLAFRVVKTATTLDKSALELTKGWRDQVASVNAARMPMVDRLKGLAADVRKPLTEWEAAEDARIAANRAVIDQIRMAAKVQENDTAEAVEARGRDIWAITFPDPQWTPDEAAEAEQAKTSSVELLVAARNRLKVAEAERAELARLRAAEAERLEREEAERVERDRIAAEERAKRERVEAEAEAERQRAARQEQAKRDRLAAEQAELDRIAAAERAAEQRVRQQAEREREAERQREREEHERQLAVERAERERIEREARAEQQRQADREAQVAREREAEAARQHRADAERLAEEEAERKRQTNRAHRSRVQGEVKEALMTCGLDEEQARKVVLAIVAKNIPYVTVTF